MKMTEFLIAGVIAFLVGIAAFVVTNQVLLTPERFTADVEIVKPVEGEFDTESTDVFTNEKRKDFSTDVRLNTNRNKNPFVSGD